VEERTGAAGGHPPWRTAWRRARWCGASRPVDGAGPHGAQRRSGRVRPTVTVTPPTRPGARDAARPGRARGAPGRRPGGCRHQVHPGRWSPGEIVPSTGAHRSQRSGLWPGMPAAPPTCGARAFRVRSEADQDPARSSTGQRAPTIRGRGNPGSRRPRGRGGPRGRGRPGVVGAPGSWAPRGRGHPGVVGTPGSWAPPGVVGAPGVKGTSESWAPRSRGHPGVVGTPESGAPRLVVITPGSCTAVVLRLSTADEHPFEHPVAPHLPFKDVTGSLR
jgi:hypothetical protein